jgi:hypothetical protein
VRARYQPHNCESPFRLSPLSRLGRNDELNLLE